MRTIEISDDIYDHLLRNSCSIGESASSILNRLLNIKPDSALEASKGKQPPHDAHNQELTGCLRNPRFLAERDSVNRFLFLLSWLHKRHTTDFKNVLRIRGRVRLYFSESAKALEEHGNSTFPQRIPDSPYWVVTNNDTPKKGRMLSDVMRILGYSRYDQTLATNSLEFGA
jgi:negative modulator of initiation of replication